MAAGTAATGSTMPVGARGDGEHAGALDRRLDRGDLGGDGVGGRGDE